AVGGWVASILKKSQQACQNASMSVVDQRHIDSKSGNVRPRVLVSQSRNSVSRAFRMRSGDGAHKPAPRSIIPTTKAPRKSPLLKHDLRDRIAPLRSGRANI